MFSYNQDAANNEELVRMRFEASIKPESRDAFAAMLMIRDKKDWMNLQFQTERNEKY